MNRLIFAAALAFAFPAAAQTRVTVDPDKFCEALVQNIVAKGAYHDAADVLANTMGAPSQLNAFESAFEGGLKGKKFDFSKKALDKNYTGALRQIIYYAFFDERPLMFVYFLFNFKNTSTGWLLAKFSFKSEGQELFPRDFLEGGQ